MKLALTKSMFRDEFRRCGRGDQFSYEALGELYDYLEENEPDYELDVIALCCDFAEDETESVLKDYNLNSLDDLHANTFVVWNGVDRVMYQQF